MPSLTKLVLFCLAGLLAQPAMAASVTLGGDETLNCRITISGEIVTGDADKLRAAILAVFKDSELDLTDGEYWGFFDDGPIRICLDSLGGSITEAIKMGDILAYRYPNLSEPWGMIGTAVASGARCESACAVLFMSGGTFTSLSAGPTDRVRNRVLHTNGVLGFHAPSLNVASGAYSEQSVNRAFKLAVQAISKLSDRLQRYGIKPQLFQHLVSTAPDDMFYIETVGQAASWRIQLAGFPRLAEPTTDNILNICQNQFIHNSGFVEAVDHYRNTAPAELTDGTKATFFTDYRYGLHNSFSPRWTHAISQISTMSVNDTPNFGYGREGIVHRFTLPGCSGEYLASADLLVAGAFGDADFLYGALPNGNYLPGEPAAWMLYPTYTQLADLWAAYENSPDGILDGRTILTPTIDHFSAYCVEFSGGNPVSTGDCSITITGNLSADMQDASEDMQITWPDGNETFANRWRMPGQDPMINPEMSRGWRYAGPWNDTLGAFHSTDYSVPGMAPMKRAGFGAIMECFTHQQSARVFCAQSLSMVQASSAFDERFALRFAVNQ